MLENELHILKSLLGQKKEGFGRPKGSTKYTQEEIDFLKECEERGFNDREIINEFNKKFGVNLRPKTRALYNFMVRNGIKNVERKYDYIHDKKWEEKE